MQLSAIVRGAVRGVMSSKRGNKNYYKGKGANPTGFMTRKGWHVQDPYRRVHFIVPELASCELKPYVSYKAVRAPVPGGLDVAQLLLATPQSAGASKAH